MKRRTKKVLLVIHPWPLCSLFSITVWAPIFEINWVLGTLTSGVLYCFYGLYLAVVYKSI